MLVGGCTTRDQTDTTQIDRNAEAYVRLVLALAARDPDSLDSYSGPREWRAEARAQYTTLPEVQRSARALMERIAARGESETGSRDEFLIRQLRAIVARIDLLTGIRRPFAEESRLLFGIDPPASKTDRRERTAPVRDRLDRLLPGRGDLTRRLADFQRRFVVPLDRLSQVLSRAID